MKILNLRLKPVKVLSIFALTAFALFFSSFHLSARGSPPWESLIAEKENIRISMDFTDADLKDVLKIFSQQADLNFMASQTVENRKVTLYLKDVPASEALEKLLEANNLEYEKEEGSEIFIVKDRGEPEIKTLTKVFYLKYARVESSRLNKEIRDKVTTSQAGTGQAAASSSDDSKNNNITAAINKIISSIGRVVEDSRTNSLIVTDIPGKFPIIEETVARLDIPIPQVMIEIEMLDINKNVLDELGTLFSNTILTYTGPSRETTFPLGREMLSKATSQVTHLGQISAEELTATLQLLQTHTDTKYLARPRLLTLSNETSEIRIVVNEAIGVTTETAAAGGATGSITQTAERAETGILLRVTPQVSMGTGEITMFIETNVAQALTGTIVLSGNTVKDPENRGTKTTVMLNDGETIVIGGLLKTDDSQVRTKVPFFGDIPILGMLFRHREGNTKNRELIIFITPHVDRTQGVSVMAANNKINDNEREQGPLSSLREESIEKALSEIEKPNNLY